MDKMIINTIDGKEYTYDYDGKKNDYLWNHSRENYIEIYQKNCRVALFNSDHIISLRIVEEK